MLFARNPFFLFAILNIFSLFRPDFRGLECARVFSNQGISCSYQLLSAMTFAIKECSLVLVSVEGIFSNGAVLGNVGTSMICLVAKMYNVPIMVCCESFKFIDRVQIDAFVYNELGDSDEVSRLPDGRFGPLYKWKDIDALRILNLKYDITPPELIDVIVTESGMIPCTSIPVILRLQTSIERFD
ncbi:Translation initiation factor eIF-2B subunit delta [Oopsacas minuta]|uniref:Translation initiation factor eIF2B subunit delta n=1 Tax=Oopsacas minuta TaxID=111878 RepID=A0AAV7JE73_9METZ|nr:Translation initiation factor eIF-2B subunit delta [Oopsacas minuta]